MKKNIERHLASIVISTGISSVINQLLIIREFLSQFNGNEFVISLILFNWLFIGGIGTFIAKTAGPKATLNRLAWVSIGLVILAPLELILIRMLRDVCFIYGSSIGFYPTFIFSFLTIMPYCLLLGFALPYSLIVAKNMLPGYSGTRIYIIDNIGDVAGGLLFSFALVTIATPFQAICVANLLLIAVSWWICVSSRRSVIAMTIFAGIAIAILLGGVWVEKRSLAPPGMEMTYYKESRYGRIEVFKDNEQYTLYLDGKPVFSSQNADIAEETIHYPLAQLDHAGRVLMISAEGGVMSEVDKYHPTRVDYVELDPLVSEVLFGFGLIQKIPGLNTIHQDGRAYLQQTDKKYDAIILNLSEPDTFQMNRFYTDQFFRLAKKHLNPDGILSFSVEGFDNYLTDAQVLKISSLYQTARNSFANTLLLPGQKIFFLCRDAPINPDIPSLLEKKKIQTVYVRGFYYGNLSDERIRYLNEQIKTDAPINFDFSPHLMRLKYKEWFEKFSASPQSFMLVLIVIMALYLALISKEELLLFSTGFTMMGSEILIIFVFQICFGYIYQQIGIIVTVFLAGLFPGALFGEFIRKRGRQVLLFTDVILILLIIAFISAITLISDHLSPAMFMMFGFMLSVACGCQFPVALYLRGSGKKAMIEVFSADLMGAAFGTLIISVALIPYVGIVGSAVCLILLKIISFTIINTGHEIFI